MTKRDFYNVSRIARRVRRLLLKKLGVASTHSTLVGAAAIPLCAELRNKGYNAIIIYGRVKTDYRPLLRSHYWVELGGFVVDIIGDQFNHFMRGQVFPDVVLAPYNLLPRYSPQKKDCIKFEGNLNSFLHEWIETI
jgi:hypothetical protein